jgi:hypothetical protein
MPFLVTANSPIWNCSAVGKKRLKPLWILGFNQFHVRSTAVFRLKGYWTLDRHVAISRGQRRAYLWRAQAAAGLCQGTLAWFAEECHAGVHGRGAGPYLSQSTKVDGTAAPMRAQERPNSRCIRPQGLRNEAIHASFRVLRSIRRPSRHVDGAYSA